MGEARRLCVVLIALLFYIFLNAVYSVRLCHFSFEAAPLIAAFLGSHWSITVQDVDDCLEILSFCLLWPLTDHTRLSHCTVLSLGNQILLISAIDWWRSLSHGCHTLSTIKLALFLRFFLLHYILHVLHIDQVYHCQAAHIHKHIRFYQLEAPADHLHLHPEFAG